MIATPAVVKFPDGQEQVVPWYEVLHLPVKRTALLTGGSGAIGGATKRLLEARGWNVIAPPRAELDFADLNSSMVYQMDLWRTYQVQPGFRFDAVIFCHGEWYSRSPFEERDDPAKAWYRQYTMRVFEPIHLIQFLLRGDPNRRPDHFLMVASTRGLIGGVNTAPYSAACAAQIALMQGYAREYDANSLMPYNLPGQELMVREGRPRVRFNVVAPGLTAGRMGDLVKATGGCKPDAVPQAPESVAGVIVGLCEDGKSNGRVVKVTNGQAVDMKWEEA